MATKITPQLVISTMRRFPMDYQKRFLMGNLSLANPTIYDENRLEVMYRLLESRTIRQQWGIFDKPYRLELLSIFAEFYEIPAEDFTQILMDSWIATEFPHQLPVQKLVRMFNRADREHIMTEEDRAVYTRLPRTIPVYRGTQDWKSKIRGLSWSTDKEVANWFRRRFDRAGKLYTADINHTHVYLYTNRRGEQEVVLNPKYLKNIREISAPA